MRDFYGQKLRTAREYRGLTIKELAEATGVSRQAISQFEIGTSSPTFERLVLLASHLNFPYRHFLIPDACAVGSGTTYFRALLTTPKTVLRQQSVFADYIAKFLTVLNDLVCFPVLNLPVLSLREEQCAPAEAARILRQQWNISGPIHDLASVLERNGIFVAHFLAKDIEVDAFSKRIMLDGKYTYLVALAENKGSAVRHHFDLAHELGHIMLHDWDCDINSISHEEYKQREKEANEFASEFLMPTEDFKRYVTGHITDIDYYVSIKKEWMLSIGALLYRGLQTGWLTVSQYQYAIKKMQKQGIRIHEPLDDVLTTADPSLLKDAVLVLLKDGGCTPEKLLNLFFERGLDFKPEEIEQLLRLPADTLKPKNDCKVIQIFPRSVK